MPVHAGAADTLVLDAIDALRNVVSTPPIEALPLPAADRAAARALERLINARSGMAMSAAFTQWSTFCSVSDATLPMEDELFIAQRELRRAQSLIESLTMATTVPPSL